MNKKLLLLGSIFLSLFTQAQQDINFKYIDIQKAESSYPKGYTALSDKIYFFAMEGRAPNQQGPVPYYLWNLDTKSKKIKKTKYPTNGFFLYNNTVLGNFGQTLYYVRSEGMSYSNMYLSSEANGEQNVISKIENQEIIHKHSDFLIISYQKELKKYFSRITSNGVEELINFDYTYLNKSVVIDNDLYIINDLKIIKINLDTKIKEEFAIPADFEFNTKYNLDYRNYFNGYIYYNTTKNENKIVRFNLSSKKFETVDNAINNFSNIYSAKDFSLLVNNNQVYKIDKNNNVEKHPFLENYQIEQGKSNDEILFLRVLAPGADYAKLAEVKNNDVNFYEVDLDLNKAIFDQTKIFTVSQNQLKSYNIETHQLLTLSDDLFVNKILGTDESRIYLSASTPETGEELYAYNKIENKVEFFGDVNSKPSSSPQYFNNVGNKVFYLGTNKNYYQTLFVSDGTLNGTYALRSDLKYNFLNRNLVGIEFNKEFLFTGYYSHNSNAELWKSDGTDVGTLRIETTPSITGAIKFLGKTPNKVYFYEESFYNSTANIWVTDGTVNGTKILKSSINLKVSSGDTPGIIVGEKLYFIDLEKVGDNYRSVLWETDGLVTKKVKDLTDFFSTSNSYLNATLLDADESTLYYSKMDVNSYENYDIYKLNLSNLTEEKIVKHIVKSIKVNNGNFYFSEYVNDKYILSKYNKYTNEKTPINIPVQKFFKSCGNYSIFAGDLGADDDYVSNTYFYNNINANYGSIFNDTSIILNSNDIACVNNNFIINYTSNSSSNRINLLGIKDDKIIEYPIKVDDNEAFGRRLGSEIHYNPELKKVFTNTLIQGMDIELAVADFYLENISTEEVVTDTKDLNSLIIYPNPADNIVNVKSTSNIQTLTVIDFTGKIIKEQNNINQKEIKLNVLEIPKGIYIIHVKTENESISKKLIIK